MLDIDDLEATHLRATRWAVKPRNACGTCGWIDGKPWTVVYVTAHDSTTAVGKARLELRRRTKRGGSAGVTA